MGKRAAMVGLGMWLGGGGVAVADAPGETPAVPVVVVAAAPTGPGVMANRWAVSLAGGFAGVTTADAGKQGPVREFGLGRVALRYRPWLHVELEASVGSGTQSGADATGLRFTTTDLSARYRFWPQSRWNLYLSAGVGATSVVDQDATSAQRSDAAHPHVRIGWGVERRFAHLAIAFEEHFSYIDPPDRPMTAPGDTAYEDVAAGQMGAEYTLGASYYF